MSPMATLMVAPAHLTTRRGRGLRTGTSFSAEGITRAAYQTGGPNEKPRALEKPRRARAAEGDRRRQGWLIAHEAAGNEPSAITLLERAPNYVGRIGCCERFSLRDYLTAAHDSPTQNACLNPSCEGFRGAARRRRWSYEQPPK